MTKLSAIPRFLLIMASALALAHADHHAPKLKSIFNGKDLSGWKTPDNNIWYSASNGELKIKSGPERKGSAIWTEKDYTDFVMEFEFKFGEGTVDSGIYVKNDKDQIQIGISGSLKVDMTALAYIPGKGYPFRNDLAVTLLKPNDWNHMKIEVKGNTYRTWLNGTYVMTYTSESAVEKGPLGIQLHGNRDMAIDYRNLKAADL
ncbi:MAG: DUF1080 domain-containing protein [Verrucomicrobiales bacterium]|nr:DUF1080 domain-containing protein [Verrucomicrobiales bacterium]